MKRLIVLALIAIPLAALALDRLGTDRADREESKTSRLAFSFPTPPAPPEVPAVPEPPAPPHVVVVHRHEDHGVANGEMPTCCVAFAREDLPDGPVIRPVASGEMATEDRALADLRETIEDRVGDWLADAGIPRTWQAPKPMVDRMIRGVPTLQSRELDNLDDTTVVRAVVPVDFSRATKQGLVHEYHRQMGVRRLGQLGSVFAFVLSCLAIVAGYIRTDEATKGYYTNRLRLLAAAGVGAAGVVLYRMMV
jgi:hypothetical protein